MADEVEPKPVLNEFELKALQPRDRVRMNKHWQESIVAIVHDVPPERRYIWGPDEEGNIVGMSPESRHVFSFRDGIVHISSNIGLNVYRRNHEGYEEMRQTLEG